MRLFFKRTRWNVVKTLRRLTVSTFIIVFIASNHDSLFTPAAVAVALYVSLTVLGYFQMAIEYWRIHRSSVADEHLLGRRWWQHVRLGSVSVPVPHWALPHDRKTLEPSITIEKVLSTILVISLVGVILEITILALCSYFFGKTVANAVSIVVGVGLCVAVGIIGRLIVQSSRILEVFTLKKANRLAMRTEYRRYLIPYGTNQGMAIERARAYVAAGINADEARRMEFESDSASKPTMEVLSVLSALKRTSL